jgi:hypothetical protein
MIREEKGSQLVQEARKSRNLWKEERSKSGTPCECEDQKSPLNVMDTGSPRTSKRRFALEILGRNDIKGQ